MIEVQFLQLASGEEVYLHEPPPGMRISEDEQIITRQVSEAEYARLIDPTQQEFKIYRHTEGVVLDRIAPPAEIDYRLLPLHRKEILDRGLRRRVDYYAHSDGSVYSDIVVSERHQYAWVPYRAIPAYRDIVIDWMLNDGSVGHTKTKRRYFTITEASKLHQKRKAANIGALKEILLQLFMREAVALGESPEVGYQRVTAMFSDMFIAVQTYEQAQEGPLLDVVANHPETILDAQVDPYDGSPTIREYLIDELTIPVYVPEN